ncbi:MAG: acetylgalactosaminidase, partial [Kiritimatiellae bacterium]|nr:acetylgalactosaminidase [Kiritimatiellia bacterium]
LPLDIDVYDTALWSSLVELSEMSVLRKGTAIKVPDFTRGAWKTSEPLGIVSA